MDATASTVFPDPNLIIENDPIAVHNGLITTMFEGCFVVWNFVPVVVLPPSLIEYVVDDDDRILIKAEDETLLAVKTCILHRPMQPRWISVPNPNVEEMNRGDVFCQVGGRTYKEAKITTHGTAGFADFVRLVNLMDTPHCRVLFNLISQDHPRDSFQIELGLGK